jgi:CDP-paratose 2-epimerase
MKTLITGGAGFIGVNLAHRLLARGGRVVVFDNLSRAGVERNVEWLRATHGNAAEVRTGDTRDRAALRDALRGVDRVFHFAAQVAVTTSLADPVADFDTNGRGTLNLLEELRAMNPRPALLFTSTNKVYGHLEDLELRCDGARYEPADSVARTLGISESRPLRFCSPYGCSKGAADQYVLDYARTFGLPAAVFRMSCIYGPHQFGNEDQGWVAHFLIRAIEGRPITIYGDGCQVRDLLYIDDLLDAFELAMERMDRIAGSPFNIGGGPASTVSLVGLLDIVARMCGARPAVRFEDWRAADQRYYVSDTRRFQAAAGWAPRVGVREGIARLYDWLAASRGIAVERAKATP